MNGRVVSTVNARQGARTLSGRTGFVNVLVVDQIERDEGDHADITRQGFFDTGRLRSVGPPVAFSTEAG